LVFWSSGVLVLCATLCPRCCDPDGLIPRRLVRDWSSAVKRVAAHREHLGDLDRTADVVGLEQEQQP